MLRLIVKVVPGAAGDEIVGWLGEELKIRVTAPPEKGKANRAVVRLLARRLQVPAHSIRVVGGRSSPRKLMELDCPAAALDALVTR